jgi:hypothetical protein
MKTCVITVIILFISLNLQSQIEKGSLLFGIKGNYSKTFYGSGGNYNATGGYLKEVTVNPNFYLAISNNWFLCLGLKYAWQHNLNSYQNYIINQTISMEQTDIHTNIYVPQIGISYFKPLFNKFYFRINTNAGIGFSKSQIDNIYAQADVQTTGSFNNITQQTGNYTNFSNSNLEKTSLTLGVNPEFIYFISEKIAMNLQFGNAEFSYYTKSDNLTEWDVSLAPKSWNIGFMLKL